MKELSSFKFFLGISFKVITSLVIIPLNKFIYVKYHFPNMLLTCIHFLFTWIGCVILTKFGIFEVKKVPIFKMIPMALSFCGFVLLNNLSLELNTMGVSQHLKVLTLPFVMVLSYLMYNKSHSFKIKLTIAFVVVGIFLNSYFDVEYNRTGVVLGLLGVTTTSFYQIWIGEKQKEFQMNSLQLLYYQAPLSAFILIIFLFFFENPENIMGLLDRSSIEWSLVILTGFIAFLFNWSVYWLIGATSALTYNIIGNIKFVVTIIMSVIIFDERLRIEQILAVVLVFTGLISYSIIRVKENESEQNNLKVKTK